MPKPTLTALEAIESEADDYVLPLQLLTMKQAAAQLGCSYRHVLKLVAEGTLPHIDINSEELYGVERNQGFGGKGGKLNLRVSQQDLNDFIEARRKVKTCPSTNETVSGASSSS